MPLTKSTIHRDDWFLEEGARITELARENKIILRLMGGVAIRICSKSFSTFHQALGRELTDLDFAAYGKHRNEVNGFFERLGYLRDRRHAFYSKSRSAYHKDNLHVDVFFDNLEMCHTISFKGILELSYPTIPPVELLLEKLQIVEINEKDIKDIITLLRAHNVGDQDGETIDIKPISEILADDWGFWYTVTMNLDKVKHFAANCSKRGVISEIDLNDVTSKIDLISQRIQDAPKSFRWKTRARVGPRRKWYKEV